MHDFELKVTRATNGFQEAKILMAGVELDLFDRLAEGPATASELAEDLDTTLRGIEILADALVTKEYLAKDGSVYSNTEGAARFLVRSSPDSQAFILGHRNLMYRSWGKLEEVVRNGRKIQEKNKSTLVDREANRNFILGMAEVSRERLGPILDRLPLAGAELFVDLGGGPAHYACEAVRRHEGLQALLVDLPLTVEVATEYIAGQGEQDRVRTLVCDFYGEAELPLPVQADVMLISQVLHAEGVEQNRALLRKVASQMKPGGCVAIVENLVDETRTAPLWGAMFAVNMLTGTERGRTYTAAEISAWLEEAGLRPEPVVEVAPRTQLILARARN
jgi:hypothetical protein